ncbi:MAG TPA: flagellar hook capping FlgD N-terminal domain-containing protein [Lacipirellulaceae bacterium]|jgi:flagellar basal-body rod modification protein FlgD|nr:flagellar hook capping FlgD N-terminal domain-containing protein [Lacipirellulaceae bacterium]
MAGVTAPATSTTSSSSSSSTSDSGATDAINNLDLGTFLTLMIKELQNQDPLNPMDNKDMLAQLSQIRSVGATDKLTSTLNSVLLGQNISSATNLIGANIAALSDDNQQVSGTVDRVTIDNGQPKLHVASYPSISTVDGKGDVGAGSYKYKVTWTDASGTMFGLDFSGHPITTTGQLNQDTAIQLSNLPVTDTGKQVWRSNANGDGPYQLVGNITDGKTGSFVDTSSDAERNGTALTGDFQTPDISTREYDVSLNNVSTISPPPQSTASTP